MNIKVLNNKVAYTNIARLWLAAILVYLPFQRWSTELSSILSYLDEITIFIFLPLTVNKFYKTREFPGRLYLILLFPIFLICISGLISGMANGNSIIMTGLGIFDYLKNFLVIFIYAAFFRDLDDFRKIFRLILIITVLLGIIAIFQEFWNLTERYIMGKDVNEQFYFSNWRLGIYRARSVMVNTNVFGLYCLLILTVYLFTVKKVNVAVFIPLFSGIFTSVSRFVYAGFLFMGTMQFFRGRKWFVYILVPVILVFLIMFAVHEYEISEFVSMEKQELQKNNPFFDFRLSAKKIAGEIWNDHFLIGAGPGMFGGIVSIKFDSKLYQEYNFPLEMKHYLKATGSIDQFWPQLMAELGIIGVLSFVLLFIVLVIILVILRIWATSDEIGGLFTALAVFTVLIFIYSGFTGLNRTSILFTYSAFIGIGIGCANINHNYKSHLSK